MEAGTVSGRRDPWGLSVLAHGRSLCSDNTPPVWELSSSHQGGPATGLSLDPADAASWWLGGGRVTGTGHAGGQGICESITALNSQQKSENLILHI